MGKYIMALDQGTTSSRCILFDKKGNMCSVAQKEYKQYYPKPGWVEHDPKEIWSSQISVATEAMSKISVDAEDIHAIGITNQRETTIVWDKKTGEPVYPAIVWQCRRTADMIEKMEKDGMSELVRKKTGLIPDAYFFRNETEMDPGSCRRCQRACEEWGTSLWNSRYLADLEIDKRESSCDGLHQRFQNHAF